MSELFEDALPPRWEMLNQEVQSLEDVLSGFTLVGVLDRDINPIASLEEEIDRKAREALVAYWLSTGNGELP